MWIEPMPFWSTSKVSITSQFPASLILWQRDCLYKPQAWIVLLWIGQEDGEVETRLSFDVYGLSCLKEGWKCRHPLLHDMYVYTPSILICMVLHLVLIPCTYVNSPSCRRRISTGALFCAEGRESAHQDHKFATPKQRAKTAKINMPSFQIPLYHNNDREEPCTIAEHMAHTSSIPTLNNSLPH